MTTEAFTTLLNEIVEGVTANGGVAATAAVGLIGLFWGVPRVINFFKGLAS
ncbi:MAG: hypothetical protein J6C82_04345 [Clostridia bacterium]|nr:hypothetical protein [Clostridia bacterium]MBR3832320.1 hypothetical protein [Mycoplasmataceae bacterium]